MRPIFCCLLLLSRIGAADPVDFVAFSRDLLGKGATAAGLAERYQGQSFTWTLTVANLRDDARGLGLTCSDIMAEAEGKRYALLTGIRLPAGTSTRGLVAGAKVALTGSIDGFQEKNFGGAKPFIHPVPVLAVATLVASGAAEGAVVPLQARILPTQLQDPKKTLAQLRQELIGKVIQDQSPFEALEDLPGGAKAVRVKHSTVSVNGSFRPAFLLPPPNGQDLAMLAKLRRLERTVVFTATITGVVEEAIKGGPPFRRLELRVLSMELQPAPGR